MDHPPKKPGLPQAPKTASREISAGPATESLTKSLTATLNPETLASVHHWKPLKRGDALGRYLVLELVGEGGMGQVYSAYDPKLDRKVALKVLAPSRGRHQASQARLIREARALARLSHPNVVAVFDAESIDERVFIATEFVVGQTFSQWLKSEVRSRADILGVLSQAGQGLAAAHQAGLVHRDFKGSNIMVGETGRVVVLDFGLARQTDDPRVADVLSDEAEIERETARHAVTEPAVTRIGAVLGTPGFMAPEQRRGESVGPAADQFSFCTVAFQALTGTLPTKDLDGLAAASLSPGLRRLLERGLAESPDDRFPSMPALLDRLTHEAGRARRRWLGLVFSLTILVILAIGTGWWREHARQQSRCGTGAQLFSEVWNSQRQAALRSSLLDSRQAQPQAGSSSPPINPSTTAAVWRSTTVGLDAYADQWAQMYRQVCEATHQLGRQSHELLDLRMDCLDQRQKEVDAALRALADGKAGRFQAAPRLISNLPSLEVCRDTRALRSPSPAPQDPDQRRELSRLRQNLATVKALWLVGDYESGRQTADDLATTAQGFGYWPLTAEVLLEKARFLESNGDGEAADRALMKTLLAAQAGGHSRVAAEALVRRVRVQGYLLHQVDEAAQTAAQAASLLERLSEPASLTAELDEVRGLLAVQQGRLDQARQLFEAAVETKSSLFGPTHLSLAPALSRLGDVALEQGRLEEARPLLERALAINRRHLGGDHPNVAGTLAQLGMLALEQGAFETALAHHSEALAIRRQTAMEQPVRVAMSLTDTANALGGLGRFDDALANFEQAVQIFETELGPDHAFLAVALSNLAATHIRQSRPQQAVPLYERALNIQRATYGPDHLRTLQAVFNYAEALRRQGQVDSAISRLEGVLERLPPHAGTSSMLLIDTRTALGEAHLELGRAGLALTLLEESLADRPQSGRRPDLWAKNAFALARTLKTLDQDPQRADQLARSALEQYRHKPLSYGAEIAAIERWLELQGTDG